MKVDATHALVTRLDCGAVLTTKVAIPRPASGESPFEVDSEVVSSLDVGGSPNVGNLEAVGRALALHARFADLVKP